MGKRSTHFELFGIKIFSIRIEEEEGEEEDSKGSVETYPIGFTNERYSRYDENHIGDIE